MAPRIDDRILMLYFDGKIHNTESNASALSDSIISLTAKDPKAEGALLLFSANTNLWEKGPLIPVIGIGPSAERNNLLAIGKKI